MQIESLILGHPVCANYEAGGTDRSSTHDRLSSGLVHSSFPGAYFFRETFSRHIFRAMESRRWSITSIAAIKTTRRVIVASSAARLLRMRNRRKRFSSARITDVSFARRILAFELDSIRHLRREKGHLNSIGSKLNGPLIAPIYPISQARSHKYLACARWPEVNAWSFIYCYVDHYFPLFRGIGVRIRNSKTARMA